jgi:hypothetical protein
MSKDKNFPNIKCWLYNITNIIDCFNEEKSICTYFDSWDLWEINKYVFNENKIPKESSLFRIPEKKKNRTMLVTWLNKPEEDFYFLYHKLWMNWLIFEEVYRTPWEKDYDLDETVKALKNWENLEKPLFKKWFLEKIFN